MEIQTLFTSSCYNRTRIFNRIKKDTFLLHEHSLPEQSMLINEMASAAGFSSRLDPLLLQCIQSLPKQDVGDEYLVSCLLMVFVAVSIPKLAKSEAFIYKAQLDGHSNNIHCLAMAVNQVFGALFSLCGHDDVEDRLKEFFSSCIVKFTSISPRKLQR